MRKFIKIFVCICVLLSMTACGGSFAQVDLKEPIALSEEGIVSAKTLAQIRKENAIAVFTGSSGNLSYEWTIFGSDIVEVKEVNLSVSLRKEDGGVFVAFSEAEDMGFPALLSIYLDEKWTADSASAYVNDAPDSSVSITGNKTSILNIPVDKRVDSYTILPDVLQTSSDTLTEEQEQPTETKSPAIINPKDDYLSAVVGGDNRVYASGSFSGKDQYLTDPVPEGKPLPVEPENQQVNKDKQYTCTFSIECSTILNNLTDLNPDKRELVPSNGVILPATTVTFYEGESVFDVLQRVCKDNNIHLEASWTPIYNSAYIEGIHNLYEFDCGNLSGWMYRVNGWYPNYGCSRYQLVDGEVVEWRFTCDLGKDVGCDWMSNNGSR